MTRGQFLRRSLIHYWRSNLAVALGAAVGAAVLAGAMLVGDSMRGSLREQALRRIGPFGQALTANRFFGESLAGALGAKPTGPGENLARAVGREGPGRTQAVPVIVLAGGATHADSRAHASAVTVWGVDERFWSAVNLRPVADPQSSPSGRTLAVNEALATALGAASGDEVLLRVGRPSDISAETLLGRRDETAETLRLRVAEVIPPERLGDFSFNPRQFRPRNAFVPLSVLQRSLEKTGLVNGVLVAVGTAGAENVAGVEAEAERRLADVVTPGDLGLKLRVRRSGGDAGYVSLESDAMLIEPPVEEAAMAAARAIGATATPVLTYLANSIAKGTDTEVGGGVPYSTVAAIEPGSPIAAGFHEVAGKGVPVLGDGGIVLNAWTAEALQARVGDCIGLSYYVTGEFGVLETHDEVFTLASVVAMEGAAVDSGFTPDYKGVTDTQDLAEWNPPFPMDLKRIRDRDEAYWDAHRATPKAFITLADGERLWSKESERFGRYTSIRLYPAEGESAEALAATFEKELLGRIHLPAVGFSFEDIRRRVLTAAEGTQDFGMLFIGFSFFLVASAAMLVALLFRLSVERRASEVGLLLATGFAAKSVARMLAGQGAVIAAAGCIIGLAGSVGYAWLMVLGLRTWWADAVNAPFLRLFVAPGTLVIGAGAGLVIAVASVIWSLRGLTVQSPHALLAGAVASGRSPERRGGRAAALAVLVGAGLAVVPVFPPIMAAITRPLAFFACGAGSLVAMLGLFAMVLGREPAESITRPGAAAILRLGARNSRRNRQRSLLTAGLLGAASFLIVSLEAFRFPPPAAGGDRNGPTGGFALYGESAVPLIYDLNTEAGREALSFSKEAAEELVGVTVMPFRLRPGDASSCRNLYRPGEPRIVGVGEAMLARGGFQFAESLAESDAERENPWALLRRVFDDGAVPVIGDEAAVRWQLHLGLGRELAITDDRGRSVPLRFVALLKGSPLQDELLISDRDFARLFPRIDGHAFFLLDAPPDRAEAVGKILERQLDAFSFDADTTAGRLASYLAVQNTYLSTFQLLGGFGLMLGTLGLAAVMLRNVWERRGELALLRALGFSRAMLRGLVLCENMVLMAVGVVLGAGTAMVAVAPHLALRAGDFPFVSLGGMLLGVLAVGLVAGLSAIAPTLRAPLVTALRGE